MAAVTNCSLEVLPHPLYVPDLAPEGVIDAVNEYLGDHGEGFDFEGIGKLGQH